MSLCEDGWGRRMNEQDCSVTANPPEKKMREQRKGQFDENRTAGVKRANLVAE
jgi:hypothetical protein